MADDDDPVNEAQDSTDAASKPDDETKRVTKKAAPARKTSASSAKKATKKIAKKGAAKKTTPVRAPAPAVAAAMSAATEPVPEPVPVVGGESPGGTAPVWDDDEGEAGWVGVLIQWGPALLLLLLVLVLDNRSAGEGQASLTPEAVPAEAPLPAQADAVVTSVTEAGVSPGAIPMPTLSDPYLSGQAGALEWGLQGVDPYGGTDLWPSAPLEDPGAFYWGPSAANGLPPLSLEESPPAP